MQSFLATAVLFGGVYFLMYLIDTSMFVLPLDSPSIGLLIFNFVYLSLVIQTTTGYGDIHPASYGRIAVTIQELVSVLYFCVILGLGLAHIAEHNHWQSARDDTPTSSEPTSTPSTGSGHGAAPRALQVPPQIPESYV